MNSTKIIGLILSACCLLGAFFGASAAQVDCDTVYCFTGEEFSTEEEPLAGICITDLPDPASGTVLLGNRVLRAGDILTAQQLSQLTFQPLRTQQDSQAVISYLPIYQNRVEKTAVMTIGIRGKEDKAPVAQDLSIETYKNLPNSGTLKASDPEEEALTFTVVRGPKRGTVELQSDGTFTYTPKKNKVGVDSFTYTATDPAGNVSRVATVTVQILKPSDARQYTDTAGYSCRFAAEWMRNTGLFIGEQIDGNLCFNPDKTISKEEFLAMVVKLLDIPLENTETTQLPATTPAWLKPYLAAAQRSGLMDNWQDNQTMSDPITGAEAAVMLQNALDLTVSSQALETQVSAEETDVPSWAAASITVMAENGLLFNGNESMTRAEAAEILYQVSLLAPDAPGMAVFRMQQ